MIYDKKSEMFTPITAEVNVGLLSIVLISLLSYVRSFF